MPAAQRSLALEACRGAVLAAHAAAGLAPAASREATRALRAAEGLLRAAAALLGPPAPQPPAGPSAAETTAAPRRRRRARRGRGAGGARQATAETAGLDAEMGTAVRVAEVAVAPLPLSRPRGTGRPPADGLNDEWADEAQRPPGGGTPGLAAGSTSALALAGAGTEPPTHLHADSSRPGAPSSSSASQRALLSLADRLTDADWEAYEAVEAADDPEDAFRSWAREVRSRHGA